MPKEAAPIPEPISYEKLLETYAAASECQPDLMIFRTQADAERFRQMYLTKQEAQ